jgi:hypothetical protein
MFECEIIQNMQKNILKWKGKSFWNFLHRGGSRPSRWTVGPGQVAHWWSKDHQRGLAEPLTTWAHLENEADTRRKQNGWPHRPGEAPAGYVNTLSIMELQCINRTLRRLLACTSSAGKVRRSWRPWRCRRRRHRAVKLWWQMNQGKRGVTESHPGARGRVRRGGRRGGRARRRQDRTEEDGADLRRPSVLRMEKMFSSAPSSGTSARRMREPRWLRPHARRGERRLQATVSLRFSLRISFPDWRFFCFSSVASLGNEEERREIGRMQRWHARGRRS